MARLENYHKEIHEQLDRLIGLKEIGVKKVTTPESIEEHRVFTTPVFKGKFMLHRFINAGNEEYSAIYDANEEEIGSVHRAGEYDMILYYLEHITPETSKSTP